MSLPVFDPRAHGCLNPGLPYSQEFTPQVQALEVGHGNPAIAAAGAGGDPHVETLVWGRADVRTRDYIESFFQGIAPGAPFIWKPLDTVPQPLGLGPEISAEVGGAQPARTYGVSFTWWAGGGETTPSDVLELDLLASSRLRVTVPRFPPGVDGWRLYLDKDGAGPRLQATLEQSRTWLEPGAGFDDGGSPPPTENDCAPPRKWVLVEPWSRSRNRGIQEANSRRWRIQIQFREILV